MPKAITSKQDVRKTLDVLRAARKRRGMTQTDAARAIGLAGASSFAPLERGENAMSLAQFFALCEVYQITPWDAAAGNDETRTVYCERCGCLLGKERAWIVTRHPEWLCLDCAFVVIDETEQTEEPQPTGHAVGHLCPMCGGYADSREAIKHEPLCPAWHS